MPEPSLTSFFGVDSNGENEDWDKQVTRSTQKDINLLSPFGTMNFEDWLVGFIEGEGSFYIENAVRRSRPRRTGESNEYHYKYADFGLTQKDKDILERVQKFFGVGYVRHMRRGVYEYRCKNKESRKKIRDFVDGKLQVGQKKKQFDEWKKLIP